MSLPINRTSKPITVTLGPQLEAVERRVASGRYASASEVLRAALRALEREETALDEIMRRKVEAALADVKRERDDGDVLARLRSALEQLRRST